MTIFIRKATLDDAAGIARVHVDSWRTTYKSQIADEFLAGLSYERREQGWIDNLSNPQSNSLLYVAETEPGQIIGFVSAGPRRAGDLDYPDYKGELYAIYLLAESQGQGTGRRLMQAAVRELCERGIVSMLLWVLKENEPSRRFYEVVGGSYLGEKPITIGNQNLIEVAYGWQDLPSLFPG